MNSPCAMQGKKKLNKKRKKKEREDYSQTPSLGQVSSGMYCVSQLLLKTPLTPYVNSFTEVNPVNDVLLA